MKQLLVLIFILVSVSSFGQTINGRIIDGINGDTISFATVRLINPTSQKFLSDQISDLQGKFKFEKVTAGNYYLKISVVGYHDTTFSNITIKGDTTFILDLYKPCEYDKSIKNNICPACNRKNKVIPIRYGLIIGESVKDKNYFPGGCEVGYCYPHWYCRRDKLQF